MKDSAENRVSISQTKLGLKFKMSQSSIHGNLIGFKMLKGDSMRQNIIKSSSNKFQTCRKLRRKIMHRKSYIIMDNEKYFAFAAGDMPGNIGFYTSDKDGTPPEVKYKDKQKFERKILVWLALSSKGISTPHIRTTTGPAVNVDVYILENVY